MSYKNIAKIIPTMQSIALVSENIKQTKKKNTTKDMLELGTKDIVGVNLLKATAQQVGDL